MKRLLFLSFLIFYALFPFTSSAQTNAWINEIHYDNDGGDLNESVEIVIENPGNLHDYEIYLYSGSDGGSYAHIYLDNTVAGATIGNFHFFTWNTSGGVQNDTDGIALVYQGTLISGQFLSYEGSFMATSGPASGFTSTDIGVAENNSVPFYKSLQLTGTGSQYTDFSWDPPAQNTFGEVNIEQTIGGVSGNPSPVIYNVLQYPNLNYVTPLDAVSISVEIFDADGIDSATIYWGFTSGNLPNAIPMSASTGNSYIGTSEIPAQPQGTEIFYEIAATDNNLIPAMTIGSEFSYTVGSPAIKGWQITAVDTPFLIDFESSLPHINQNEFAGTGFQPVPQPGQLDSNSWSITGFSDGNLEFDGVKTIENSDYAQGISFGGITPAGIYAFRIGSSVCLGVQPGGDDFTPGNIILKIHNQTETILTNLRISFDVFVRNDETRANTFAFGYSADNINYIPGSSSVTSTEVPDSFPFWQQFHKNEIIAGISIAPNEYYYLRWTGNDLNGEGSRDEFGLDNILLVANPSTANYVYNNNSWSPTNPNGTAGINDNILVQNGIANLTQDIAVNNITVNSGAILKIEQVLTLGGTITNNGSIVFINDGAKLGQLAAVGNGNTITEVTVQRFIPARRAFRFVSSAVTSTANIHENWQEGADNNMHDPNPGFGTHITGTLIDQTNGFDATLSGNPSLFLFDHIAQEWYNIPNTDATGIIAGKAYRLFVRGDRTIDLTDNAATPSNTILRATGEMFTGNFTENNLSEMTDGFGFVGNPFQAIVNMNEVLENSVNLNKNHYYIWDPNLNERGAYVTVKLPKGTPVPENSTGTTAANQYLQPGQAAFVLTLASGPASIFFEQIDKAPFQDPTDVFRGMESSTEAFISLQLYETQTYLNNGSVADGLRVNFDPEHSNDVLPNDAGKLGNIDENVAILHPAGHYLSIENRKMPTDDEIIQLFLNQYRHNDYTLKMEVNGFPNNVTGYLKDNYLQTQTELTNNGFSLINFQVDENSMESVAPDRFSLVFEVNELSMEEPLSAEVVIFPNPSNNDNFFIAVPGLTSDISRISIYNILGKEVYTRKSINENQRVEVKTHNFKPGMYLVKLICKNKTLMGKVLLH